VSDDPGAAGGQGDLVSRLRAVVEAKDEQIAAPTASLEAALAGMDAERELRRRMELWPAERERRLSMDSTDSGMPSSKERIGAEEARRARQQSERERSRDRRRGGQPGHQGKGPGRDPDPSKRKDADPSAECRPCKASLDGAAATGSRWAQVIDAKIIRTVTEWTLPGFRARAAGRSPSRSRRRARTRARCLTARC
jgi:transposase